MSLQQKPKLRRQLSPNYSLSVSPSADFSKSTFFSTLQVNRALQCILLSLQNPRFFYGLFKSAGDFKALDRTKAQKIFETLPNIQNISQLFSNRDREIDENSPIRMLAGPQ